jgi:hypothetical protein
MTVEMESKSHAGAGAAQWLADWDAGMSVESISMGGLSEGYEQCIQITAFEVLRALLARNPNPQLWYAESNPEGVDAAEAAWKADHDAMEATVSKLDVVRRLGLSGAQWGAANNLAFNVYQRGVVAMQDPELHDRHILVRRGPDPMAGMTTDMALQLGIEAGAKAKAEGGANG